MRHTPSLRFNFSWTLLGSMLFSASHAATMIALTRLGSPALIGQFALSLAIAAPVMLLSNMQLATVQATDTGRSSPFSEYFGTRIAMSVVALAVIALIAVCGEFNGSTRNAIIALGIAKMAESINDVFYGLFQQCERMDFVAKSMIVKGLASIAAMVGGVHATGSVAVGGILTAGLWTALFVTYDLPRGRGLVKQYEGDQARVYPHMGVRAIRNLAWLAAPLGVAASLDSLAANLPRYFLQHYYDEQAVGIYSAIAYFMVAAGTVASALARAARPRLARLYRDDRQEFRRLSGMLVWYGFGIGAVGITVAGLAGEPLLRAIYTAEYAKHSDVLVMIMIAATCWLLGGFIGTAVTAGHAFRSQVPIHASAVIFVSVGCWLLVPTMGLMGAALGIVIGFAARVLVASYFYLRVAHAPARPTPALRL